MFWIGILMVVMGSVFASRIQDVAKRDKSPEAQQLEKELSALRSKHRKLSSAKKELTKVEKELGTLSPDRFGCKSTEELQKVRDSRRALIKRVMGSGYAPSNTAPQGLPADTTDKIIGYIPNVTFPAGITVDGEEDLLRLWCLEAAKLLHEKPGEAEKFATEDSVSFADWLVCSRRAVICRISQCSLIIISEVRKPELPQQFLDRLTECGVKAATQVKWRKKIRRYEFDDDAGDETSVIEKPMLASDVIAGLPL